MDVGIIGAGPAGAYLALELARGGAQVKLYDDRAPWEKPCGGGAPYRAVAALGLFRELPRCEVHSALLEGPGGELAEVPMREPLVIFSRTDLSRHMLRAAEAAGAEHDPRRVARVALGRQGEPVLELADGTSRRHEFLVGADGARSIVRRSLGRAFRNDELTQAAGYTTSKALGDRVVLRFCREVPGYVWYFPRVDHASVGICAPLGAAGQGGLAAELDRFCADWGIPVGPAYGALIPCSAAAAMGEGIAGPGWALVGDAAGIVDPITREGIYYAIETAGLLAAALLSGARAEEAYPKRVREALGAEMAKAHALEARFYRPRFTQAMVWMTGRSGRVRGVMADLLACRQGYVGLKRRLLRSLPLVAAEVLGSWIGGRPRTGDTPRGRLNCSPVLTVSQGAESGGRLAPPSRNED